MSDDVTRIGLDVESDGSQTDWGRVLRLTEAEIESAVAADPDAYLLGEAPDGRVGASYRYHIYRSLAGDWRWRLIDAGGEVLAVGAQGFPSRDAAQAATRLLRDALLGARSEAA